MTEWKSVRVGEVAQLINGDRGKNYPSARHRTTSGIPFINAGHLEGGRVRLDSMDFIPSERYQLLRSGKVEVDDVLLCIRGSIGRWALVTPDAVPGAIASSLVILRSEPVILPQFLAYHLASPEGSRSILASNNGAAQPNVGARQVASLPIPLPPLEDQRRIVEVLGAIDGLIENNRRRIRLLEEMARAIYREWFVKFRYPGHGDVPRIDSVRGSIPEGWSVSKLSAIADITMGQSPKSEFYNENGIGKPFHQGVADFGAHFPSTRKWCKVEGRPAFAGDVLISVRAPVGRINIADTDIAIGRGLAALRAKDGRQALLLGHLRNAFAEEDSIGNDGAIFKSLGKVELASILVAVPPNHVADIANATLSDNLDMIRALSQATRALSKLRDRLLPKLVTGRIDLSKRDFDALIEEQVA